MKKKIIGSVLIAAIAVAAGWNFNQSKKEVDLSDLALANVEALAACEKIAGSCWLDTRNNCCDAGDYGCAPCDD
ncbi:MAG: hypothetical protein KBI04_07570 [Paludibacteraceae bacterium]|jgi:hypothetical protein|nr:hypothetical protein [Paludibacteraceae bacterium]